MTIKNSIDSISRDDAIELLKKEECSDDVIAHCLAVSKNANRIAEIIKRKGYKVDINFVEIAALLHDIGRCKTHGIEHGIKGAVILRKYSAYAKYANVCERHIGAGITKKEAKKLGLPIGDYMPMTLEEKIIAHADNVVNGTEIVSVDERIKELKKRFGKNHEIVKRIKELADYIEGLCQD